MKKATKAPGKRSYPQRAAAAEKSPGQKSSRDGASRSTKTSGAKRRKGSSRRKSASSLWTPIVNWGGTVLLWCLLIGGLFIGYFALTLPDISNIGVIEKRPAMVLETQDHVHFSTYGDLYGDMLSIDQIPSSMKRAVLATEDSHFYSHFGINPLSLIRAAIRNYQAGRIVQGGSTITQQLAKNLFLTPDRTIGRKIRETLLAFWLEAEYSKDEILALYLNRMYFGSGTYGIDAASRKYFAKPATQLNTAEAAMLAGLLKAPTYYAPTRNLKRAQERAAVVLQRMVEEGFLPADEAERLRRNPAVLANASEDVRNIRYFSDWVVSEVQAYIGRTDRDLIITTTLDLRMQSDAEQVLEARLKADGARMGVSQGALVAMAPDGAVKAMVGGRSYSSSVYNRATLARRQPGSVFKTVVYAAGFENGLSPDDIFHDGPININGWTPSNYSRTYSGDMTLREAFARSINTVAIKVTERIGRDKVATMARKLGLSGDFPLHPSISLGTNEVSLLEMTAANAVLANGGTAVLPYAVLEIREKDGEVLYRRQTSGQGRLVSPATVNKMRDVMSAVIQWGTGRAADPGFAAAGKTGTTQDYRDAWFIGFTPDLVAGIWFGNDDGTPTKGVMGSNLPAVAWKEFIVRAGTSRAVAFTRLDVERQDGGEGESLWDRIVRAFSAQNAAGNAQGSGATGGTEGTEPRRSAPPPRRPAEADFPGNAPRP